ncbi:hypothetical protein GH742_05615 [Legionella sp. MW5194]|nr:hypothetical protein GH742_05615 [Legionella sp. MW5194]
MFCLRLCMNIYFFGDSICFGQFVSPTNIWINLLTSKLEEQFNNVIVQNPSVNGRTTRQALEDMSFQIQSNPVDILYIQFGMNDCNHWVTDNGCPRVSIAAFKANLLEIIDRAIQSEIKSILLGTNHPTPKTAKYKNLSFSYQTKNEEYNEIIRDVAREKNIILVDHEIFWRTYFTDLNHDFSKLILPDGIHLSIQGHVAYFNHILPIFTQELIKFTQT